MRREWWVPVVCGAVILTIGLGARQSFGIFQKPIAADLQVGRELWSFGNAIAMLLTGALAPFVGGVERRLGAVRTVAAGGVLYVLGMATIGWSNEGVLLILGNALTGVGTAAAGFGPIFAVVNRAAPLAKRSLALGITTAGGSFGQFAVVPFASILLDRLGDWHATILILAAASAVMIPLAWGLREARPESTALGAGAPVSQGLRAALSEAFATPGFWLLTLGFFVCGFHVSFVGLHLPPYISDKGVGMVLLGRQISPAELGGWAVALVGLFNIVGAILWGWLGGRHARKDMLALLYFLRALAFIGFLLLPTSAASILLFAATLGFLWLGTVPLTSGLVAYMFGPTHMSMLWGIVFFSHQVGSFLGGWGGGRLYDLQGNYDLMWWIAVGLGLLATLIHLPIREVPVARLAARPA
ncbi:MAG: MFS transporter [Alphaproteobacteria bacterium]|nr:MFS transporter [Alphaproteobacteria bacterium]